MFYRKKREYQLFLTPSYNFKNNGGTITLWWYTKMC